MFLSNTFCSTANLNLYDFDYSLCLEFAEIADNIEFGNIKKTTKAYKIYDRKHQTDEILIRLNNSLIKITDNHKSWLNKRHIDESIFHTIDYSKLSVQDKLDLFIYPSDHVIAEFGLIEVDGPAFCDYRNNQLVGIGIRNTSTNLDYVAASKYTFSNFGLFLWGFDDYDNNDTIYIVEGVFDAIVLRKFGYNAIATSNAWPTCIQLACIVQKYKNIIVCLDNDLHGWCGSYMCSKILGCRTYTTESKDIGEYATSNHISLKEISQKELKHLISKNINSYNTTLLKNSLHRQLPYN